MTAAVLVQVVHYPAVGEAADVILLGERPAYHHVSITDISAGVSREPGSDFDWFCSCGLFSEGLPNGDGHPSVQAADRDAVGAHESQGIALITSPPYVGRDYPNEVPF